MTELLELRLRSKISAEEMEEKKGKMLKPSDVNVMLTGPTRLLLPNGQPLCVYRPKVIPSELIDVAWPILHSLKGSYTENRGMASGAPRFKGGTTRTRAVKVDSGILGSFEAQGPKAFCRLTAWTGRENEQWRELWPLFRFIGRQLAADVPDRYANQARAAAATQPEWVVPGTPFTTITVNNTYATAVHTDAGDLETGFSTLTCLRRGDFTGGWLCFPEYRVGVDLQEGDLLLMDAHCWHGNTPLQPEPERNHRGLLVGDPGYERISIVSYFRTKMTGCGTPADEAAKARIYAENRHEAAVGE